MESLDCYILCNKIKKRGSHLSVVPSCLFVRGLSEVVKALLLRKKKGLPTLKSVVLCIYSLGNDWEVFTFATGAG